MEKQWYQSKTIIGAGIVIAAGAFQAAGITVNPATGDFSGNVYTVLEKVGPVLLTIGGGALAIWGRMTATTPIRVATKKKTPR